MIINQLIIKNLYGYMNKEVDFNKEINLLVGINGSGKTSVLNIINWILTPSFQNLCTTEYSRIELKITFNEHVYRIISKQNIKEVTIDIENVTQKHKFPQIQADIEVHPSKLSKDNMLKEKFKSHYAGLSPEKHEEETWNFLFEKLPNPIVIGLDRNLYIEDNDSVSYVEDIQGRISKRHLNKLKSSMNPLEKVLDLSSKEYMQFKNRIIALNSRLKDKIMLSSFDEMLTQDNLNQFLEHPKITIRQVKSLEVKVKDYFEENEIGISEQPKTKKQQSSLDKMERYFSNLKSILNQEVNNNSKDELNILYMFNANQFRKIKDLIKDFEDFENKSKKFFKSLHSYLETINLFLKDSSKELYFDKNNSKLKYRILNKDGSIIEENRDISALSSGEKQILILFTYIKFNHKLKKIFIIDEPELSLHPKWQETFLERIKIIMPTNTQLLFATHSPAIVGKNKKYCKPLLPYNS